MGNTLTYKVRLLGMENRIICHTCGNNGVDDLVVVRNGVLVDGAVKSSTWRKKKEELEDLKE